MIHTEIALILSSKSQFDPEAIAGVIPLRPFSVWRRKPGLIVHGIDDIPEMSWIIRRETESVVDSQRLVESALCEISACGQKIRSAIEGYGLRGTVICRLASTDESYCVEIPPDLLRAVASCGCTLQFDSSRE